MDAQTLFANKPLREVRTLGTLRERWKETEGRNLWKAHSLITAYELNTGHLSVEMIRAPHWTCPHCQRHRFKFATRKGAAVKRAVHAWCGKTISGHERVDVGLSHEVAVGDSFYFMPYSLTPDQMANLAQMAREKKMDVRLAGNSPHAFSSFVVEISFRNTQNQTTKETPRAPPTLPPSVTFLN